MYHSMGQYQLKPHIVGNHSIQCKENWMLSKGCGHEFYMVIVNFLKCIEYTYMPYMGSYLLRLDIAKIMSSYGQLLKNMVEEAQGLVSDR